MMTARRAIILIPCEQLVKYLGLPEGTVLHQADTVIEDCSMARLVIEHPDLAPVAVGNRLPAVNPIFTMKGFKAWC
jgi:hypothetical protein